MTPIQIVTTRTGIALTPFVYFLSVSFESRTETPDSIANCSPLSLSTKQLRFQFRPNLIGFFVNLKTLQGISVFYIASSVLLHHISSHSSVLVSFCFSIGLAPSSIVEHLEGPMFQDDGSSSVTSTPNQIFPSMAASCQLRTTPYPWLKELKSEERGLRLIHLLLTCATHVTSGNFDHANLALDQISHLASPEGDTMQRIASYFAEALANRILKSWPGLYKALHSTKISTGNDDILFRKSFFDCFPFLKIAFVIANQTIIEAMEGEKMIHVVDLNAVEPTQWRALLHEFAGRPGGPPHLRITGIHHQKKVLHHMASTLTEEAEKLDIPFQFNPIVTKLDDLDIDKLKIKTGEALAISSILQFHLMLTKIDKTARKSPPISKTEDSFTSCTVSSTKLDRFLNRLWGLSPKIMVVAEQESDHNQSDLMERLSESLYFYAALFDCSESTLPRTSPERLKIEKMFGEEIKNIIACDGEERIERHEKLDKWIQRLSLMGFGPVTLSYYGLILAQRLIHGSSCNGCRIKEKNGCVVICWQDRPIFSVSAWNSRR